MFNGKIQPKNGDLIQADFFQNVGGLNNTDSPFSVNSSSAVIANNVDYTTTGGIKKRNGGTKLNSVADSVLRSIGLHLYNSYSATKTPLRATSSKFQTFDYQTGATTNLTDDTVSASTTAFSSTEAVQFTQFNSQTVSIAWANGGGNTLPIGYNGTKWTTNGVPVLAGSISGVAAGSGGTLPDATKYYYSVALHKLSTGAISNAGLDTTVTTGSSSGVNKVTLTLSTITAVDTTKYDLIYIYRSNAAGVSGFTVGDLITTVATGTASYVDTGAVQGTAAIVPRAGNINLDNSVLPAATYNTGCLWKRRYVVASGSTLQISDLNKSESWPTTNPITIPSGGNIIALASVSVTSVSATSTVVDEYLAIFKERELWVLVGSSYTDWSLKFIDNVGCPGKNLPVIANGFLMWLDYRGVYLWDGSGKPVYTSRPIEFDFNPSLGGDIDLSKLAMGCGDFFRKQNQVVWYLSSSTLGEQMLGLKMDVRLTLPAIDNTLGGRILEGVFLKDTLNFPIYAVHASYPTYNEAFYVADASGFIWSMYNNLNSDSGTGIAFKYRTRPEDFGMPGVTKRFHKVILWCLASSLNNLTVNYWVDYKIDSSHSGASQTAPISTVVTNAIWDQGTWDTVYWDQNIVTYNKVTFNLQNNTVGNEGDALTLEFNQSDANAPVSIAGYTVYYSILGMRN